MLIALIVITYLYYTESYNNPSLGRHFVKGVRKRIFKAANLKGCNILMLWQQSILNSIWYALATCEGIFTVEFGDRITLYAG